MSMVTNVRISRTVLGWFEGTDAWQPQSNDDPDVVRVMRMIRDTGRRSDGSVVLDLTSEQAAIVREYAVYMESAASDWYDPSERGELIAARALQRQLYRRGQIE